MYLLLPALDSASVKQEDLITPELTIIGGNSLVGIVSPVMEEKPLYDALIAKLCHCESTDDPNKVNQNDMGSPSYGILQFKVATYGNVCMKKYGFDGDIMNPENQIECVEKMLEENFDNVWNWSNCYKQILWKK